MSEVVEEARPNTCALRHTTRVQEEKGRSREVCVFCDHVGPWWNVTQVNGPYGRDLFIYERPGETVIRWGELKENEARIPEWALEKLIGLRLGQKTFDEIAAMRAEFNATKARAR